MFSWTLIQSSKFLFYTDRSHEHKVQHLEWSDMDSNQVSEQVQFGEGMCISKFRDRWQIIVVEIGSLECCWSYLLKSQAPKIRNQQEPYDPAGRVALDPNHGESHFKKDEVRNL